MSELLKRPRQITGRLHDITPESARSSLAPDWRYVGFSVYKLSPGESAGEATGDREAILVLVEGKGEVAAAGDVFGELGERMNVFERTPPHCVYVPDHSEWSVRATTELTLAVGTAPGKGGHPVRRIGPEGIELIERGKGTNTRFIHNIAMDDQDVADSLLMTEVYTPAGHWSSYPPHRHDEDDGDSISYLEETYYHRINPSQGFGHQRVFTEDGSLDETLSVSDHDVVLVPRGHHPCAAPYGYEMYYLNVMAGPKRKWMFRNHPDHEWIVERDA